VTACVILAAGAAVLLCLLVQVTTPAVEVFTAAAMGAVVGRQLGDRSERGETVLRLLLAAVWVALGLTRPDAAGLIVASLGAGFGVLVIVGSASARRGSKDI